jgi:hypothetical protein
VLNNSTTNAELNGTLSQSAGNTISGFGEINAALTNNGVVNANFNGQTLFLQTNNMTNNLTFEATGGGILSIDSITVTQGAAGTIASNSSPVVLSGVTIIGGSLAGSGTGSFTVTGGTDAFNSLVGSSAILNIPAGNTLNVTGNLANAGTINVNSNQGGGTTILSFSGSTLSGGGSIVLNNSTTNAELNGTLTQSSGNTISGFGEINAALTNNGVVNANFNGQTLSITHAITGTGNLNVTAGAIMAFSTGVGGITQGSVTIASTGNLDLANNHMFINYGTNPDPVVAIIGYLKSGYAGGAWNGPGLRSSSANSNAGYALGYGDGKNGLVAGLTSGQIEVKYTLYGDINLDGVVNGTDFSVLAAHFGQSTTSGWAAGDLNYDGTVNGTDFSLLAGNFGKSASGTAVVLPASEWAALDSFAAAHQLLDDVPEPASIGVTTLWAIGMLGRRCRREGR